MKIQNVAFLAGNITNFDASPIRIYDRLNMLRKELKNPTLFALLKISSFFNPQKMNEIKEKFKEIGVKVVFIPRIFVVSSLIIGTFLVFKRIKLIHADNFTANINSIIIKKLFKINYIFDYHGAIPEELVLQGIWKANGLRFKIAKYLEKKIFIASKNIITISNKSKAYIDSITCQKEKSFVIPCGINRQLFFYADNKRDEMRKKLDVENKFVLAYCGSISPWNDYPKMMRAIRNILASEQSAIVLIISNNKKERLLNLLNKFLIDIDKVIIVNVKHEDVGKYLQAGDLGVLIRKNDFVNEIASPIKFAEYLSCGVPVLISNNVGDATEALIQNELGFLYKENKQQVEYQAIIEKIKASRKNYIRKCVAYSNEIFDLENYKDIYLRLYNQYNK